MSLTPEEKRERRKERRRLRKAKASGTAYLVSDETIQHLTPKLPPWDAPVHPNPLVNQHLRDLYGSKALNEPLNKPLTLTERLVAQCFLYTTDLFPDDTIPDGAMVMMVDSLRMCRSVSEFTSLIATWRKPEVGLAVASFKVGNLLERVNKQRPR